MFAHSLDVGVASLADRGVNMSEFTPILMLTTSVALPVAVLAIAWLIERFAVRFP